jgi:uncharacterized protein (TIGR00369 family)
VCSGLRPYNHREVRPGILILFVHVSDVFNFPAFLMATSSPAAPSAVPSASTTVAHPWKADYDAALARVHAGRGVGSATRADLEGRTGLELMQAMLAGLVPAPTISATMGFALVEVAHGKAVFQGAPSLAVYNPLGTVHGGWYATLLDSAVGCAVHTALPAGRAYTTAEVSVNIVRAASADTGPLRAIGTIVHVGRQLATAEGRIVDITGKIYAHATTTCLVFEAQ